MLCKSNVSSQIVPKNSFRPRHTNTLAFANMLGQLGVWESRNLEIRRKSGIPQNWENENSQNANTFCPKCRQGLDYQEQNPLGPILGHLRQFFTRTGKIKISKCCLFSLAGQWAKLLAGKLTACKLGKPCLSETL